MSTDRSSLLWGTAIGLALVAAGVIVGFYFPHLRMPPFDSRAVALMDTAITYTLLIAGYRKLWREPGFWALLSAFFAGHVLLCFELIARAVGNLGRVRLVSYYGVPCIVEFFTFAVIIARVYHRGPELPSWLGPPRH